MGQSDVTIDTQAPGGMAPGRSINLAPAISASAKAVDAMLETVLPRPAGPQARVQEAMRYAITAGGKRLRPFLVLHSARLFGVDDSRSLRVGAAIEALHTYSLVHDDLPCMDDDDLRRGRPTTHIAFDEMTAVLAGDALLTIAFEILADARNTSVKSGGTVNDMSASAGGGVVPPAGAGPAGSEGVAGGGPAEGMATARR